MISMVLLGIGIHLVLEVETGLFPMLMIQSFWKIKSFQDLMKLNYITGPGLKRY